MKDLCYFVVSCLRDMGVVHWLDGGSLLGAVREGGKLLAWEDDVDISVLLDGDTTWETLATGIAERGARDGYFVDVFKEKDFIAISYDPPRPMAISPSSSAWSTNTTRRPASSQWTTPMSLRQEAT
jgi:hypothetical protein